MILIIKRYKQLLNCVTERTYKVYLAEFTRGGEKLKSGREPYGLNFYELGFEKAADGRPQWFKTSDSGACEAAKPGDLYYLLVIGKEIAVAAREDACVLRDEFREQLIREV